MNPIKRRKSATTSLQQFDSDDKVYVAGHRAPAGSYSLIDGQGMVVLETDDVLPATLNGRVAMYRRRPDTWGEQQVRRKYGSLRDDRNNAMKFKEVRMTVATDDQSEPAPQFFLMDADKANDVVAAFDAYKQTGQPETCEISFEDSGEVEHRKGLAGESQIRLATVIQVTVAPDPLSP